MKIPGQEDRESDSAQQGDLRHVQAIGFCYASVRLGGPVAHVFQNSLHYTRLPLSSGSTMLIPE